MIIRNMHYAKYFKFFYNQTCLIKIFVNFQFKLRSQQTAPVLVYLISSNLQSTVKITPIFYFESQHLFLFPVINNLKSPFKLYSWYIIKPFSHLPKIYYMKSNSFFTGYKPITIKKVGGSFEIPPTINPRTLRLCIKSYSCHVIRFLWSLLNLACVLQESQTWRPEDGGMFGRTYYMATLQANCQLNINSIT